MIPRGRGAIVNIASQAGLYGAPGGATYSATKHGVVGLSEAIRGELRLAGHDGIQVSLRLPGRRQHRARPRHGRHARA